MHAVCDLENLDLVTGTGGSLEQRSAPAPMAW
jgi:hypothetical protein